MPTRQTRYAPWLSRVLSALIDYFGVLLVAELVEHFLSYRVGRGLDWIAFFWGLYNAWLAGRTGQSVGKRIAGTRLLNDEVLEPLGGLNGVLRMVGHLLDIVPAGVGFLAPLWDGKRRCFADMFMKTVVIVGPAAARDPAA
jgi:uncharacterized RDD family membrane protein YckC